MNVLFRRLWRSPGYCATALLTLALGIGVNSTSFTVLNRLLLASLPYRDPQRLVQIFNTQLPQGWQMMRHAPGDYLEERKAATSFSGIALYVNGATTSLSEPGQTPMLVGAVAVTDNFFPLLGLEPRMGRLFTEEEWNRFAPLVVVSSAFWQNHYGGDPHILGRTVVLGGKQKTIIGVMPPALDDPLLFGTTPGFWQLDHTKLNPTLHGFAWYTCIARLRDGVTREQAQSEMAVIAERLAKAYPATNKNHGLAVEAFPTARIGQYYVRLTWMVSGLSLAVLLIACVNLANLQLVRTTRRAGELAVRLALGCSRRGLIGLVLGESITLSLAGGLLGLLVARWMNAFVERYFRESLFEFRLPIDFRVLGFTLLLAATCGAFFGSFPAWLATRTDIQAELKAGGRSASAGRARRWFRETLVVVEVSLALLLLVGAGFFVAGVYGVTHRNLGWSCENGLTGWLGLDHDHFGEQRDPRSLAFGEHLIEALKAVPGVEAVSLGFGSPAGFSGGREYRMEGDPPPQPGTGKFAPQYDASPDFLRLFGLKLLDGRNLTAADRLGSPPVVLISAAMAKKFWPGRSAVGHRIGFVDEQKTEWSEIVGVVSDFRGASDFYNPFDDGAKVIRPWAQNNHRFIGFSVRTGPKAEAMRETVRRQLAVLAPEVAPSSLITFSESMESTVSIYRLLQRLLVQLSTFGLLLAAGGLYGVVASLVGERRREVGIRMALGAQPGSVVWLFLRTGLLLTTIGLAIGVVASVFLLQMLRQLTFIFPIAAAPLIAVVSAVLLAASLLASWIPAHRTSRMDPTRALRAD